MTLNERQPTESIVCLVSDMHISRIGVGSISIAAASCVVAGSLPLFVALNNAEFGHQAAHWTTTNFYSRVRLTCPSSLLGLLIDT